MGKLLDLFVTGGVFMYPLAIFSIAALAIALERVITEYGWRKKVLLFVSYVDGKKEHKEQLSPVLHVEDTFWGLPVEHKEKIIEEKLQLIFDRRLRLNEIISAIGNTAPLLGFIGTVSGMIGSFDAIASADKVSVKLVASGISEALITTGFGLVIATVCIITDALLRYWFTKFSHDVEEHVTNMLSHSSE